MVLRNTSNRTITLRDSVGALYTIPAYSDLSAADGLWTDTEFRRWLRLRVRDIVVDATAVSSTPDAPSDAPYITTTANAALSNEVVLSNVIQRGTLASRPAASIPGRLYYVTDTGAQRLTRDNGATWDDHNTGYGFLTGVPTTFSPTTHQTAHQTGQVDALTGNIDATARHTVKSGGTTIAARRAINFTGNVYAATDNAGAEQIDILIGAAYGTSPPGSPVDGQWWIYPVDPTNGIIWKFRYDAGSASAFKWVFIGGTPLYSEIATSETTTSTTYANLSTIGPSITLPRAGDWIVELGLWMNVGAGQTAWASYDIGGTGAVDADAVIFGPGGGSTTINGMRRRIKTGLAVSTTLQAKYRVDGGTGAFKHRWIGAYPIRIS
jgi:hypothetical protein